MGDSLGKLILRLSLGGMMLLHGVPKLMDPSSLQPIGGKLAELGLPEVLAYGVYAGEILAPVLIIIGLFTRIGGLLIAVNMVIAIILMHMGELMQLNQYGGWALELQGFYLFCGLAIMFMGGGRIAIESD